MDKIVVQGGAVLRGEVAVSGSKNAALPCLFATLLTDEPCTLEHVPDLEDIRTACSLLHFLGKEVRRENNTVVVRRGRRMRSEAPYELVRRMRASALVLGPLLARSGHAAASLPGGCAIGNRPINIHLEGFERMGARAKLAGGMVRLAAPSLKGRPVRLSFPSVGATENLLMAAALAQGGTILDNAACEPEIVDCVRFLKKMGAAIEGAGSPRIRIVGRKKLSGAVHRVIPDRIEAATFLIAAAATRGRVRAVGVVPEHLLSVLEALGRAGLLVRVERGATPEGESAVLCAFQKSLRPVDIETSPFPGFPTDVQAQWMALMSLAGGVTTIRESIFENRYLHAAELTRMGARIAVRGNRARVQGIERFSGAHVMVSDLRAGAALVIAALAARGKSVVHRIYHLDRGYENLEGKFRRLGADIKRLR